MSFSTRVSLPLMRSPSAMARKGLYYLLLLIGLACLFGVFKNKIQSAQECLDRGSVEACDKRDDK